jgi:hypothetical protein
MGSVDLHDAALDAVTPLGMGLHVHPADNDLAIAAQGNAGLATSKDDLVFSLNAHPLTVNPSLWESEGGRSPLQERVQKGCRAGLVQEGHEEGAAGITLLERKNHPALQVQSLSEALRIERYRQPCQDRPIRVPLEIHEESARSISPSHPAGLAPENPLLTGSRLWLGGRSCLVQRLHGVHAHSLDALARSVKPRQPFLGSRVVKSIGISLKHVWVGSPDGLE